MLDQPPLPSLVAPVASVMRFAKLRPLTGRLWISSGETLTPIFADDRSMTLAEADTVTAAGTTSVKSARDADATDKLHAWRAIGGGHERASRVLWRRFRAVKSAT